MFDFLLTTQGVWGSIAAFIASAFAAGTIWGREIKREWIYSCGL